LFEDQNITIREDVYFQNSNHAFWSSTYFLATTNLKVTRFFKVIKEKMPKKLDDIIDSPDIQIIINEKKINVNSSIIRLLKKLIRAQY